MSAPAGVWAPLLPVALVGTDRHAAPLPRWPGAVGALLDQATQGASDAASAVLRASAVLAACAQAGAQGAPWTGPLPAPCAVDPLPEPQDAALNALMAWTWQDGPARLQHELCAVLARAGHRLPAAALPAALEQGRRALALRPRLLPVLGARGLWLAAHRDDWRYAAGVVAEDISEARWTDGTAEQRQAYLTLERTRDPATARARLSQALPELGAKERAELLGALAVQLGDEDAELLDSLRADRSREVRQVALGLLLRLPAADHPQRAAQRMAALVRHERALLLKRWTVQAPEAPADDWKADNVEATRPQHESLGERAWWLAQLVRQVPLRWWSDHTGMSPAELLRWAAGTDWAEALLRGWRDALFAAPDADWCRSLLDDWPAKGLRDERHAVLALLPAAERERHWQRQLEAGQVPLAVLLGQVLIAWPLDEALSKDFSLALLRRWPASGASALRDDLQLRSLWPELCCALHPAALGALAAWPRLDDETPALAHTLHTAQQVIATRRALHAHFAP